MALTFAAVEHIAKLAKLALSDAEKEAFAHDLDAVLGYMEKLNELDTENVEPLSHTSDIVNVMREDVVTPSLSPDEAVKNAPRKQGHFFKVPKVL